MEFLPRNLLFALENFNTDVKGWERISIHHRHSYTCEKHQQPSSKHWADMDKRVSNE